MTKKESVTDSPEAERVILASEAIAGRLYRTTSKPPIKVVFKGFTPKGECLLHAYHAEVQEWRSVAVPKEYKLIPLKEDVKMPKTKEQKEKARAEAAAPKQDYVKGVGRISAQGVYPTWGIYFAKFATSPNAVKMIADGMRKEFPGRKTQWEKWVNGVRNLYNRGKLGVPAPAERIRPYVGVEGSGGKPKIKAKAPKKQPAAKAAA